MRPQKAANRSWRARIKGSVANWGVSNSKRYRSRCTSPRSDSQRVTRCLVPGQHVCDLYLIRGITFSTTASVVMTGSAGFIQHHHLTPKRWLAKGKSWCCTHGEPTAYIQYKSLTLGYLVPHTYLPQVLHDYTQNITAQTYPNPQCSRKKN